MNTIRGVGSGTLLLGVVVAALVIVPVNAGISSNTGTGLAGQRAGATLLPGGGTPHPFADDSLEGFDGERNSGVGKDAQTPAIAVDPVTLQFPDQTNDTATRELEIENVGNATLQVRSLDIVGPDQGVFDHDFDGPETLEPGENRTVTVSYTPIDGSSRFATLHVLSDDPDAPQVNVWVTNTEMVATVSPSRLVGDLTMVNSTVDNAVPNTTQSLNISWPVTRDDLVAVDALAFTPTRSGNFTINVTKSTERFGGVPEFERDDGTELAAYIAIDHSIANEDIRNATLTLRVRKDRLADDETGPEDVALYRYQDGTWTELPTRVVSEDETHYFYEATSPGLSDFATGVKQAKFRIAEAVVTVTTISTGEGTDVIVRVDNVGGADGTYSVRLISGDEVVERQDLSIAPNSTRQATFGLSYDRPGVYEIYVNDNFVTNVTVNESGTPASEETVDGDATPLSPTDQPGSATVTGDRVGIVVALLAVLAVLGYAVARRWR